MREHPILFSSPMVRALLAGQKTQTRRLKPQRWTVGDRLWVREAWALHRQYDEFKGSDLFGLPEMGCLSYKADAPYHDYIGRPRHARFMPRLASRITLEVVRTWQEPLQDISEPDAIAEGITDHDAMVGQVADPFRAAYAQLWDLINGAGSWDENPTVFATEFKICEARP